MGLYLKNVPTEMIQWTGDNFGEVEQFVRNSVSAVRLDPSNNILIGTLEGQMTAPVGHWLAKGPVGEVYAIDPEIHAMTYVPYQSKDKA